MYVCMYVYIYIYIYIYISLYTLNLGDSIFMPNSGYRYYILPVIAPELSVQASIWKRNNL